MTLTNIPYPQFLKKPWWCGTPHVRQWHAPSCWDVPPECQYHFAPVAHAQLPSPNDPPPQHELHGLTFQQGVAVSLCLCHWLLLSCKPSHLPKRPPDAQTPPSPSCRLTFVLPSAAQKYTDQSTSMPRTMYTAESIAMKDGGSLEN
jgi:hypothetical protein